MATITQWKILKTLSKREKKTQEIRTALALDGIDLTLRSVQRNLEKLSEMFPITSDHQNPARWRWAEGCELLDLPSMEPSTALTLCLAEQYLADMIPKGCLEALRPYMHNARKLLDEVPEMGVARWPKSVARLTRTQHLIHPEIETGILDVIYQAIIKKLQIKVEYRSVNDEQAKSVILHPFGLVFDAGVIYLVATAWEYEDIRQYVLHRILRAEALTVSAKVSPNFNLEEYIEKGGFEFPLSGEPVRIKLRADQWLTRYLSERRLSDDQQITKDDKGTIIDATVINTLQLKWWLLGLENHVEVLAPSELRQTMRSSLQKMYEKYAN